MRARRCAWIVMVCLAAAASAASAQPHAYFEGLRARPDHWTSYSLRDDAQLRRYAVSDSAEMFVTYDAGMDAARVLMPWFVDVGAALHTTPNRLGQDLDASATTFAVTGLTGVWNRGRSFMIDEEIFTLTAAANTTSGTVTASRGQFGTVATPHAAGTTVLRGGTGLQNQVRLPLGTANGHTYLFTWDVYNTETMLRTGLTNHKAFQFATGGAGRTIWLEVNQKYAGDAMSPPDFDRASHVASAALRGYMKFPGVATWQPTAADGSTRAGPGMTKESPLDPWVGTFAIAPDRWMRWWVRIDQRANDFDYVDVWVADEVTGPVQLYARLPCNIPTDAAETIGAWWIEFNTSNTAYTKASPVPEPMVVYVRNFVALVDPPVDVTPLLTRPATIGVGPPAPVRSVVIRGQEWL